MMESKASNPKELIGASKLDFSCVPSTAIAHLASAMVEGGLKYGPHNYREAGVKASTYYSAGMRHLQKWWEGADTDPKTRVHHLANTMACCAILLDAEFQGMLNDDRPIRADLEKLHERLAEVQAHLTEMFKDKNPIRYTHQWKMADIESSRISGVMGVGQAQRAIDALSGGVKLTPFELGAQRNGS